MKLDPQTALAGKSLLLLDFDGPVCSVFAGYPAPQIAAELVVELRTFAPQLADTLGSERDPMEVLRAAAGSLSRAEVERVDEQLTQAELAAVESAEPTAGMADLIATARRVGLAVAVVSNNSAGPIAKYLKRHGLDGDIGAVIGRPFGRPERMKPDPYLLHEALSAIKVGASDAVFIGDSLTDVEAGTSAGVMTVGFANKPGKALRLREAGAEVVVDSF
ncbi:HAD family hydrolase [Glycomyces harbinensis]|uniref:Haloacid dehalogenase superfamily, subfamily IA, variant 3 with third motif having DD or ED/haloacid dehalogenase superfamily, subfamily IA, variant 1 with third motif having Dx(3-4)D or Dx(3-4)E n=1 Tax=Glycomyces harbinensis TaxID=58114 RepID=A0A1G6YUA0_9ACTN|nr:HAD-IA family hydrolase [Glycomyces harbinensis]SDD93928.1 haloacid dehalogenase superfamily, subfamily IA, variant 3 with third motif having DD or ED/haloacid dehalogenase superfamily, subfamily IA, variant 1 with third motif having Dx(3-4)D or Dx(3-4)E [Glycomyces harbinensis]